MQMSVGRSVGRSVGLSVFKCSKSVIFAHRSFKFFAVVDIEVANKLEGKIKRGVALSGRGTCEYTLKWA